MASESPWHAARGRSSSGRRRDRQDVAGVARAADPGQDDRARVARPVRDADVAGGSLPRPRSAGRTGHRPSCRDRSGFSTNASPPTSSMRSTRTTAGELAGTAGPLGVAVGDGAEEDGVAVSGGGTTDGCPRNPPTVATPSAATRISPSDRHQRERTHRPGEPATGHRVAAEDGEGVAPAGMAGVSEGGLDRPVRAWPGRLEPRAEAAIESFELVMRTAPSRRRCARLLRGRPGAPGWRSGGGSPRCRSGRRGRRRSPPATGRRSAGGRGSPVARGSAAGSRARAGRDRRPGRTGPAPASIRVIGEQPDDRAAAPSAFRLGRRCRTMTR